MMIFPWTRTAVLKAHRTRLTKSLPRIARRLETARLRFEAEKGQSLPSRMTKAEIAKTAPHTLGRLESIYEFATRDLAEVTAEIARREAR